MSKNHPQREHDSNDAIDAMFAEWKESLQCSDAQRQRMLKNVLLHVDSNVVPLPVHRRTFTLYVPLLVCSLAAALLVGVGLWNPPPDARTTELTSNANESLHRIAFSADELHQDQELACEFARVFEKPVLVLKHDANCDIDDDPFVADAIAMRAGASRVLLRYVIQELSQSQTWMDIAREEVIGGREQHLEIQRFPSINTKYWSHLLPDNSLWVELHVQANQALDGSGLNELEHQLKANEPKVVWEHQASDARRRLVMVYELLPSCDSGDVL